jgi:hypothetical protein
MSWDEIYDEGLSSSVKVGRSEVLLKTHTRIFGENTKHYLFMLGVGADVLAELGWTAETKIKYQWGRDENLGALRIAVIKNAEAGGWPVKVCKAGYASLSNKALPKNVNKAERADVSLLYGIVDDPRDANLKVLQLTLPEDFYLEGPKAPATTPTPPKEALKESPKSPAQQPAGLGEQPSVIPPPPPPGKPTAPPPVSARTALPDRRKTPEPPPPPPPAIPDSRADQRFNNLCIEGGDITPEELCRYLTIREGDKAKLINDRSIEINGDTMNFANAASYVNRLRKAADKPFFRLSTRAM